MKLLFDANLSHFLVELLSDIYPDSQHVRFKAFESEADELIWEYAQAKQFTIVTKDVDFYDLSLIHGFPPKVIWIRRGNCSTTVIEGLLRRHSVEIKNFLSDKENSCYMIF